MSLWTSALIASALSLLTKLAGFLAPQRLLQGARTSRIMALLPVAMLAALVAVQSFAGAVSGSMPNAFSTGGSVLADCLDIAAGCGSFYDGKAIRPCAVDNGAVVSRFYCRTAAGAEISEPMSVAQAFERIRRARENDPGAFFARLCF